MTISDTGSELSSDYDSEEGSIISRGSVAHKSEIPKILANYWLSDVLGSGYSGAIQLS